MAESNAPEHQDRGLFGLFGKKKEEETHEQHPTGVDPHAHGHVSDVHHAVLPPPVSHVPLEEAHEDLMEEIREGGLMEKLHHIEQHPSGVHQDGHGRVGDVHHAAPPPPVSHLHVEETKHHGEGEKKPHEGGLMGKLHRSNSSSSSSSSDEEGGEKGEKKKKKKGGLREKVAGHKKEGEVEGEKKEGLMEKIKEKLPGHHSKEEDHSGR